MSNFNRLLKNIWEGIKLYEPRFNVDTYAPVRNEKNINSPKYYTEPPQIYLSLIHI